MAVQRKLEILADANPTRGIPQKALPFIPSPREAIHAATSGEVDCFRLRSSSYGGQSRFARNDGESETDAADLLAKIGARGLNFRQSGSPISGET